MDQANTEMYTEHQHHHEAMMSHDENSAPLAQADVNTMQGLTLDDLTRMHNESEGQHEEQGNDDSAVSNAHEQSPEASHEDHESIEESAADLHEETESIEREISDQASEIEPTSKESAEAKPDLAQSLRLDLEEDSYHLAQLDDLTRFAQDAKHLFEARLPDIMTKLSKTLHAHEQLNHLYGQLAQLSSQRESASIIMQTARQIESMEAILANEQAPPQDVQQAHQDVQRMQKVLQAYEKVLSQIQQA